MTLLPARSRVTLPLAFSARVLAPRATGDLVYAPLKAWQPQRQQRVDCANIAAQATRDSLLNADVNTESHGASRA